MRLYISVLLAALVALAGVLLGYWWAPFAATFALGAIDHRARVVVPAAAAIGLLAWTVPLAVAQGRYDLGPTARSLAAIMGFDHQAVVPVLLTLIVGTLLGLSGAWLASAARGLVAPRGRIDVTGSRPRPPSPR